MHMKIIDCFPFFNEEYYLILRIKLLKDVVDKFVMCEGNRTHSGERKDYLFSDFKITDENCFVIKK